MILFDCARASTLMREQGMDVLLAHTRPNAGYLADYWSSWISTPYLVTEEGAPYQLFAGLPADQGKGAFVTCKTGGEEQQMFFDQVWIEDKRMWGPSSEARAAVSPWGHDKLYEDPFQGAAAALRDRGLADSTIGVEMRYLGVEPCERLRQLLPGATFVDALPLLRSLRMIKTDEELRRMKVVADATARVLHASFDAVTDGTTGLEIEKLVTQNFAEEGLLREWAEISIGPSGAENMQPMNTEVKRGEIIRIDTGARFKGYYNDISKVAVLGQPDREVERAYIAARSALVRVCEIIKPGIRGADVYAAANEVLTDAGYQMFCPVICHGLGRLVHEPPHLTATSEVLLEAGMVMAIEPALVLKGLGIMALEDEILVTEDGCVDLSTTGRELYIIPG